MLISIIVIKLLVVQKGQKSSGTKLVTSKHKKQCLYVLRSNSNIIGTERFIIFSGECSVVVFKFPALMSDRSLASQQVNPQHSIEKNKKNVCTRSLARRKNNLLVNHERPLHDQSDHGRDPGLHLVDISFCIS